MAGLPGQTLLHNQYWLLRHGRSVPNEARIIVSSLANGVLERYGLAPDGVAQARVAGDLFLGDFRETNIPHENVRIYSSPFSRTRQTAEAVREVLREHGIQPSLEVVDQLRERYFGPDLELQPNEHYTEIWEMDERNPTVGPEGGESALEVSRRVASAIIKIDQEVRGCAVLIISHGDPLQILQTLIVQALSRKEAKNDTISTRLNEAITPFILQQHNKFAMMTGELRRLG